MQGWHLVKGCFVAVLHWIRSFKTFNKVQHKSSFSRLLNYLSILFPDPHVLSIYEGCSKSFVPNTLANTVTVKLFLFFNTDNSINQNTLFILLVHIFNIFQIKISVLFIQPIFYSWLQFFIRKELPDTCRQGEILPGRYSRSGEVLSQCTQCFVHWLRLWNVYITRKEDIFYIHHYRCTLHNLLYKKISLVHTNSIFFQYAVETLRHISLCFVQI